MSADFASPEFARLAPLVQERAATLSEAAAFVEFLFTPDFWVEDESFEKAIVRDVDADSILAEARDRLEKLRVRSGDSSRPRSRSSPTSEGESSERCKHRSGWRHLGAPSVCRCSSPWRYWGARGRSSASMMPFSDLTRRVLVGRRASAPRSDQDLESGD